MTAFLLHDGAPVRVRGDGDRIGTGPWARWVAGAVVPDESSTRAEQGRELARSGAVHSVAVEQGTITARVSDPSGIADDDVVAVDAALVPGRIWADANRAARRRPLLVDGVEGRSQSIHLAHLMETEHHEPLVPPTRAITTSCSCREPARGVPCVHVAAVAFVVADAVDANPAILLRWRGCEVAEPPASRSGDPWLAGRLPAPRAQRALPPGAVVKRLGRSGIRVGNADLADALEPAYRAFAALSAVGGVD